MGVKLRRISLMTVLGGIAAATAHLAVRVPRWPAAMHPDRAPRPQLRVLEEILNARGRPDDSDPMRVHRVATDVVELVQREVRDITGLADHLYGMVDVDCREADLTGEPYVRLDDLRWLLGGYVLQGSRIRRLVQLPALIATLTDSVATESADDAARSAAIELLARIRHTNAVVIDWLLLHRVALPDPDVLDSNALFDRYSRVEAEPSVVSADPLYLLTCHLHDALETADAIDDPDHPSLRILETQLGKPLAAVDEEITAVLTFNAALATLARRLRPAPTEA
ncbi:MAG TPA: hypothetical protein VFW21_08975 [Mycobacterium sp.]|nr:hypothetical protein [Mycobacterium sp.]